MDFHSSRFLWQLGHRHLALQENPTTNSCPRPPEGNAEIHRLRLFNGDHILLCSDGLHDMVDDEQIAEILKRERASNPACEALVKRALDNGGKDNVTVVVAGYSIPEVS